MMSATALDTLLRERAALEPFRDTLPLLIRLLDGKIIAAQQQPSLQISSNSSANTNQHALLATEESFCAESGFEDLESDWTGATNLLAQPSRRRKQMKLPVPADKYPQYNFVGRLLGPRGTTLKLLERDTSCKIMIRGRGSIRKDKEEEVRGKPGWEHVFSEPLHVVLEAGDALDDLCATRALERAKQAVETLLIPVPEDRDRLKRQQLRELAILNGTYRGNEQYAVTSISSHQHAQQSQTLSQLEARDCRMPPCSNAASDQSLQNTLGGLRQSNTRQAPRVHTNSTLESNWTWCNHPKLHLEHQRSASYFGTHSQSITSSLPMGSPSHQNCSPYSQDNPDMSHDLEHYRLAHVSSQRHHGEHGDALVHAQDRCTTLPDPDAQLEDCARSSQTGLSAPYSNFGENSNYFQLFPSSRDTWKTAPDVEEDTSLARRVHSNVETSGAIRNIDSAGSVSSCRVVNPKYTDRSLSSRDDLMRRNRTVGNIWASSMSRKDGFDGINAGRGSDGKVCALERSASHRSLSSISLTSTVVSASPPDSHALKSTHCVPPLDPNGPGFSRDNSSAVYRGPLSAPAPQMDFASPYLAGEDEWQSSSCGGSSEGEDHSGAHAGSSEYISPGGVFMGPSRYCRAFANCPTSAVNNAGRGQSSSSTRNEVAKASSQQSRGVSFRENSTVGFLF